MKRESKKVKEAQRKFSKFFGLSEERKKFEGS